MAVVAALVGRIHAVIEAMNWFELVIRQIAENLDVLVERSGLVAGGSAATALRDHVGSLEGGLGSPRRG